MAASQGLPCTKCGHSRFEVDEIRTTGKISRFLNIQHKKFTAIVCAGCGYTELYRGDTSRLASVLDFLAG